MNVAVGAAHLRVRGSFPRVEILLPAPWHWPRLVRMTKPLLGFLQDVWPVLDRGDLEVRIRYGPFSKAVGGIRG